MRRMGEISLERVKRGWPHYVAITADKVMGRGYDIAHGFADTLSVGPRAYDIRRDNVDYVVFCFSDPTHADLFAARFDGERWDIYRAAAKAKLIGTVEAADADAAIEIATKEFNIEDTKKLIAV